jgi:hypothetical protein
VQFGVHPGLKDWDAPQFVELGGVGVEVERAGDDHIEPGVPGLARGRNQVGAGHGAKLRPNENRSPVLSGRWSVVCDWCSVSFP